MATEKDKKSDKKQKKPLKATVGGPTLVRGTSRAKPAPDSPTKPKKPKSHQYPIDSVIGKREGLGAMQEEYEILSKHHPKILKDSMDYVYNPNYSEKSTTLHKIENRVAKRGKSILKGKDKRKSE